MHIAPNTYVQMLLMIQTFWAGFIIQISFNSHVLNLNYVKNTQDKKLSNLCKHDAFLTAMKHCDNGKTKQYKYYGNTSLKILSFDNSLTRNNVVRLSTHTQVKRLNLRSRFTIQAFIEKQCLETYKKLDIDFRAPRSFVFFFKFITVQYFFTFLDFF